MSIMLNPPCKLNMVAMLVLSALAFNSYAEDTYTFDDSFIEGNHNKADLSRYTSSELAEGVYSLDIFTNDQWKGRYDVEIKRDAAGKLGAVYTAEMLNRFGVSADQLNKKLSSNNDFSGPLSEWTKEKNIVDTVNKGSMRVDISVPQAFENHQYYNYVDSSLWDKGIPALNLGWNGNIWNSRYTGASKSETTTGYLGLDANASIAGWRLRHQGNVRWNNKDGAEWDSSQTYLQRPIPEIKSVASVGQISGTGEFFDSVTVRGVSLKTDTSMYPDSMTSFAPEIRGVASSNALVTIRQSGKVIHETTVAPGPFVLTDFHPTGYGNDLEVTVKESSGAITRFTVPYNSGAKLLHPGLFKYELIAGKPDSSTYHEKPVVYQGTAEYGFNNIFTGYTGFTGFNGEDSYQSYLLGLGFNTPIGGFSVDVTSADLSGKHAGHNGNMYRASYSRRFDATNTSISLIGIKYSEEGFYDLNNALSINDGGRRSRSDEKSNIGISVNQRLPSGWGSLYANGRLIEYWNRDEREKQYQLSYNNSLGKVYYDLSVQRVLTTSNNRDVVDNRIGLNFSVPLDFGRNNSATVTSNTAFNNTHYTGTSLGINGTVGEYHELTYGVSGSNGDNKNVALNAGYRTPYGVVNGGYSQGSDYRQTSLSGNGSIVAHSGGVIFTPESGDTLAIVEAKGAKGAKISSTLGSTIDSNGYAVVSSLRPYRVNSIEIDPKGSGDNVYFNETLKQVSPYAGSVVKLTYDVEVQDNLLFTGKLSNGKPLPFGTSVYNVNGVMIGTVGQGGAVFIKDASSPTAKITWKGGSCSFKLPKENNSEVVCQ